MKTLALVAALMIVPPSSMHIVPIGKPDLVIASAIAVKGCGSANPYFARVTVANRGTAASPQRFDVSIVSVQENEKPPQWSGGAGLPAVPVNGTVVVDVKLAQVRLGSAARPNLPLQIALNSGHWIDESNFANNTGQITGMTLLDCQSSLSTLRGVSVTVRHVNSLVHDVPSGLTLPTPVPPQTRPKPAPADLVAPPTGFTYTTDPTVCVNHVGLGGAFICQQIIAQAGLLLLVWDWAPCSTSHCVKQIQGYHLYAAPPPPAPFNPKYGSIHPVRLSTNAVSNLIIPRTPLDTQADPNVTMRGLSTYRTGQCFVVTAFGYGHESDDSNTFCVGSAVFVAAPWNVRYIKIYETCNEVFGSSGYLQCAGSLDQKHLVVYWNWNPCAASAGCVQNIDGFNLYYQGGTFVTQQSNAATRGADVGPFEPGLCYTIRAYHGNVQSDPSTPFCVTPDMVPTPQPPPTAQPPPMHVDIDITDDSYPDNTIVAVGGSVTWKNDDTDTHDIYFNGGSFYQLLEPGQSVTRTFTGVGSIDYLCHYHNNMRGTITVVAR